MMDMAHAALSTPTQILCPTHVALTIFASNLRLRTRSCWWRGGTVLSMSNLLPSLKPLFLIHYPLCRFKSLALASDFITPQ